MRYLLFLWFVTIMTPGFSQTPERVLNIVSEAEIELFKFRGYVLYERESEAILSYHRIITLLDSFSNQSASALYKPYLDRMTTIREEAFQLYRKMENTEVELQSSSSSSLEANLEKPEANREVESNEMMMDQMLSMQNRLTLLTKDTAELRLQVSSLENKNESLKSEIKRYTSGIFFGLGFGYNYFIHGPYSYYLKPDSSLGRFGKTHGMSFMLSGFLAYKITPRHSVIFNVPLGDITSREDYRVGLFNKKMAGGLGYGYNLGSVSLICIVNISPYDEIEFDLVHQEKFEGETFSVIQSSAYPTSTHYSPSFTIGLSYNFIAPEKLLFDGF